ncbi:MAG: ROK family transcriptional regulator [Propionivibrio sp.]|nr:ROK family transcriptional regulator [Propionivibrio sp.]
MNLGNLTMLNVAATAGPGGILALIRSGEAVTRAQIMAVTGLSRSTVAQRLDALIAHGYIAPAATENSTGGRPAGAFQINADAGVMLLAAIGAGAMQVAVCDMGLTILARQSHGVSVADGPIAVLGEVMTHFDQLLTEIGRTRADVKGIGIGVPGPVEFAEGRVVRPPIMTGWDGYRVPDFFAADYTCPIVVDKDANLMALGEHRGAWPDVTHMLFIKISTGIGTGLIMDGALQRGAQGAAGDLGHLFVGNIEPEHSENCRCGNTGCLEAYASGWAICRDLTARGHKAENVRDIAALAQQGVRDAIELLQTSGRLIGESVAVAVSLLNPSLVVLGGELALCQGYVLAAVRETVYRRSLPLATRNLQIATSKLGHDAGLMGAAQLVSDAVFAPAVVDAVLEQARQD